MEPTHEPELPPAFFSVQLSYAERAVQVLAIPLEQALMEFTSFWRRIHDPFLLKVNRMEWSFETNTPQWRELCDRMNNKEPADTVAYDLYLRNNTNTETGKQYFGCFRYDLIPRAEDDQEVVRVHFRNRDHSGFGPLSKERQEERRHELKQMFHHIREHHPGATMVTGGSWLYNIPSYQRLFPAAFITNMKVEATAFPRSAGIWGQFVNSDRQVNERTRCSFIDKVNAAKNVEELLDCFEYKIMFPHTGIEHFYRHLAVTW